MAERAGRRGKAWIATGPRPERPRLLEHLLSSTSPPEHRLAEIEERLRAVEERIRARAAEQPTAHVLFVPSPAGYAIVAAEGAAPSVGAVVGPFPGAAGRYLVTKIGPSPLPDDPRPCAFLQSVA